MRFSCGSSYYSCYVWGLFSFANFEQYWALVCIFRYVLGFVGWELQKGVILTCDRDQGSRKM
jgi:hypothetical protein